MKIGEFSKKYNLTRETIRYYVSLGLIFPQKLNKQNIFDKENELEVERILELKNNCFTLEEMKSILYFEKLIKNPTEKDIYKYNELINSKMKEISFQIDRLEKSKEILKNKVKKEKKGKEKIRRGVPIEGLDLLKCPECGENLNLSATSIENSEILEGILSCNCNRTFDIKEGIIFDNIHIDWNNPWINQKFDKASYFEVTPNEHIEFVLKSKKIIDDILTVKKLKNKRVLNLRCGGLDHFSSLCNNIDGNKVHFFMDTTLGYSAFKHLKDEYDKMGLNKKIIFFLGDYSELPLKNNVFDFIVDILATSNYNSYNYSLVEKHLKSKNEYLGKYTTSESPLKINGRFIGRKDAIEGIYRVKFLEESLRKNGYKIKFKNLSEIHQNGGGYNGFYNNWNKGRGLILYGKK